MAQKLSTDLSLFLTSEWPLPLSATLGSAVRAKGIAQEIKARLPWPVRKCLAVETKRIWLAMPENEKREFEAASLIVAKTLEGIEAHPLLPREVEDILAVTSHERQKWTKDCRLKSAGTRTVKLRGRAKAVTFHVFDPRHVEDVLDRDLATVWREEDAQAVAEARRRAAGKAARNRAAGKGTGDATIKSGGKRRERPQSSELKDWEAFDAEGLLR